MSTPSNTPAIFGSAKLKANDTGTELHITAVTAGTEANHGTVALSGQDGTITYTPAASFTGSDSFTYTLTEENGCAVEVPVTVTVGPGNSGSANVVDGPRKIGEEFVVRLAGIPGAEYTVEWSASTARALDQEAEPHRPLG